MGKRVATEYVNAVLTVTEAEMPRLIALCEPDGIKPQVFVLEGGNQEIVMEDKAGETVRLAFERQGGAYRSVLTCRVVQPQLTNVLRKLVSAFNGDAVVNRIYEGFVMVYHYVGGSVVRIVESRGNTLLTVYEQRDTAGRMENRFRLQLVEEEIRRVRQSVNELLDRRNETDDRTFMTGIDEQLKYHSRLLFALEA